MNAYPIVIAGAACAGFLQGLTGFGFSLVSLSFWAWVLDPLLAATLAVFGGWVGQVLAAFTVRRKANWRHVLPFVLGGLAGLPLGLRVLPHLDPLLFKAFLGLVLALWCPIMLLAPRLPRLTMGGRGADGCIGIVGGAMGAMGGFSGVIPTLWCTLRGFDRDTQRGVIQNFNLTMLTVTLVTYCATGMVTRDMLPSFAIIAPIVLVTSLLGGRVYVGVSDITFRRMVLGTLTASGIAMLIASVPKLLGSA